MATSRSTPEPTVIVDRLEVRYRSYATGKAAGGRKSLLRRQRGIREVHALRGVSLVAHEGESIGVIGANGSGKSTLMRCIAGFTQPAAGAVYASSRPTLLGVNAALLGEISGERNVILGGLALGMSPREIEAKAQGIIEFAGVEDSADMPMNTYSSGMSARLRFAIAVARPHSILLVDEALAVGDKEFRVKSEARIRELRDAASTVFLVSHSMKSIRSTCDRVIWLRQGEIVMDGDPDEVVKAYERS